ncbi:hypothetical protein ASE37_18855 [Rhizobium sp. Root268]|nr:hypothetical protein ASC86_18355 [Rhizobium sp. Root1212]KRD21583.1 hypothetical protein ASE37_18855 [Rhizobium sp. Root268]
MSDFRIESDSPLLDLRAGDSFETRAVQWLMAAHRLVDRAIDVDRQITGYGDEVSLLLTNRQADHLAMGLALLATHFSNAGLMANHR